MLFFRFLLVIIINQNLNPPRRRQTTDYLGSFDLRHLTSCRVPELHPECSRFAMNRKGRPIEHYRHRLSLRTRAQSRKEFRDKGLDLVELDENGLVVYLGRWQCDWLL